MEVGGNAKCRQFFESSVGYERGMSITDKYSSHFAAQYKDKLLAELEGREWNPSDTPAPVDSTSNLRKPRSTSSRGPSPSPTPNETGYNGSSNPSRALSPGATGGVANPYSQKSQNESYFAAMGSANDSRSANLPPSQGGKYAGFGSDASYNPSTSTSSRALPSVDEIRGDPVGALGRGWGFMSAAIGAAGRQINESVVQPTLERAHDPNLHSQFSSYLSQATTVLGEASRKGGEVLASGLQTGGDVIRRDLGYNVGDLGAGYVDRVTGRGAGGGYGRVGGREGYEVPSAEEGQDDFFGSHLGGGVTSQPHPSAATSSNAAAVGAGYKDELVAAEDGWGALAPKSASRGGSVAPALASKKVAKTDDWGEEW